MFFEREVISKPEILHHLLRNETMNRLSPIPDSRFPVEAPRGMDVII
jgi:hypothetical protein